MIKPRDLNKLNPVDEMKSLNQKLIIMCDDMRTHYFFMSNGRISEFHVELCNTAKVGDVYLARVEKVNKSLNGCFAMINNAQRVYVPFDPKAVPIIVNRQWNGKLCQEDQIVIVIKKEKYEDKQPLASYNLSGFSDEIINDLKKKAVISSIYTKLINGNSFLDYFSNITDGYLYTDIICNDDLAYNKVNEYLSCHNILKPNKIVRYKDESISLVSLYGLKKCFAEISEEKVWLKTGGYLYIEKTKAMTIIDVNSGKIDSKSKEEALVLTNDEAVKEIAYQIRARNISGIIIVDFINIKDINYNTILIKSLTDSFTSINPALKLVDITKLGLAEIIRQKKHPDIYEYIKQMNKTILM